MDFLDIIFHSNSFFLAFIYSSDQRKQKGSKEICNLLYVILVVKLVGWMVDAVVSEPLLAITGCEEGRGCIKYTLLQHYFLMQTL